MSASIEDLEITTATRLLGAGRVRGPQGAVVIGTWGPPEHCEAAAYVDAVGAPEVFALARPGALEDLAVRGGLTPAGRRDVVCVWSFPDEPTLLRALTSVGVADAAFTDAILEAVAPYRTIDGGCRLENVFTYLVARAGDTTRPKGAMKMATPDTRQATEHKAFSDPDEVREFPNGRAEILNVGGGQVGRYVFEPGWRWSNDVKPIAGTHSCEVPHFQYHLSGRLAVRMDDGTEFIAGPGDITSLPQGHDGWVVGDEPAVVIDWYGASSYARES